MDELSALLSTPVVTLGATTITLGQALIAGAALAGLLLLALGVSLWRSSRAGARAAAESAERAREAEDRLSDILKTQSEMQGRMATMAELFGSRQGEIARAMGERLDGMTHRLGQSIAEQTKATHENLSRLQERLAVIDAAQGNIQSLAGQVAGLQAILSNKQTRGAFGQARMEAIVADGLPPGSYEFQATLASGFRPDCLIRMPNGAPSLAIDAKFPLESFNAIRSAEGNEALLKAAVALFRRDMDVHIKAVADKYLVPGETQDTAFLFVPSESVFAEIHENHEAIVQRAHRARIVIVSPSLLMLSIQVIQSVLKDARMREQAHLIQGEVMRLMEDLGRLDERVRRLHGHFGQTAKDIDEILVSTAKVTKRGQRIEALEFGELPAAPEPAPRAVETKSGQLRLKVVEDE
ncbi:MAG: DNA recombination protein RmuC [Phyllobacteriaceae bacterium]|nr:DNA recombination protein RmuC [Phyllobacteriaceae bacterium]